MILPLWFYVVSPWIGIALTLTHYIGARQMSETQDTKTRSLTRLRRFRSGGYGQMVEDERGAYVRYDDLIDWLGELESKLHAYEQNGRAA